MYLGNLGRPKSILLKDSISYCWWKLMKIFVNIVSSTTEWRTLHSGHLWCNSFTQQHQLFWEKMYLELLYDLCKVAWFIFIKYEKKLTAMLFHIVHFSHNMLECKTDLCQKYLVHCIVGHVWSSDYRMVACSVKEKNNTKKMQHQNKDNLLVKFLQ